MLGPCQAFVVDVMDSSSLTVSSLSSSSSLSSPSSSPQHRSRTRSPGSPSTSRRTLDAASPSKVDDARQQARLLCALLRRQRTDWESRVADLENDKVLPLLCYRAGTATVLPTLSSYLSQALPVSMTLSSHRVNERDLPCVTVACCRCLPPGAGVFVVDVAVVANSV